MLSEVKGIEKANLDLEDKYVTVVFYADKTTGEKIKHSIILLGYDADNVVADAKGYEKLPSCCRKSN